MGDAVRVRAVGRKQRPLPSNVLRWALAIALLVHALLAWWLRDLMQPQALVDAERIEVRLIDAIPPEPALPVPPAMPVKVAVEPEERRALRSTRQQASVMASAPQTQDTPPEMSLQLYNRDGSIALPAETLEVAPSHFSASSTAPSALMARHRPLKIRPNYFAKVWRAPQNETLLGETLRKVGDFVDDNLTVKKEFTTPSGGKIKCEAGFMFIMAAAGCGWGFAPEWGTPTAHWKPATELDEE